MVEILLEGTLQTLYMVFVSVFFASLMGIPLGLILVVTDRGHILENHYLKNCLSFIINILRSVPFIILLVTIIPLTRLIVGTAIGTTASIVPLTLAATPFVARVTETALKEVPWGVVEAGLAMGGSKPYVLFKIILREGRSALIRGITITTVNLISYSAMAGMVGGKGLGDLAIRYGYQGRNTTILYSTVLILILLVQIVQHTGNFLANKFDKSKIN
ncbi:D-methionine transport system permease protein [Anaerobranca californiensis DSM 14826]|jgi:D-methionine transport system permease protein|uniref:D-methionine transport system permease protein n=1 Tax=Anaerobranca californiensis DSM 14826 TaxID=1120989 RepID=A0A1M6MIA2_9FIRM|nr:methionine ABC transporter permease [Anaerobranca californiensis]SHJ83013.1 D-methionine transport system permease protein [Anaerobranca californiensis DSM 14826]